MEELKSMPPLNQDVSNIIDSIELGQNAKPKDTSATLFRP